MQSDQCEVFFFLLYKMKYVLEPLKLYHRARTSPPSGRTPENI